ncbi:MAG: YegP family protein [Acidobacteria bacterium]|nr:YegP family protein [Acidobacteriota bacterium]
MRAKFELKKAKNGEFYFTLRAPNGQAILASERYKAKASAKNGIASVKRNAPDATRYLRKKAKNGKQYFVLTATNAQVIGKSEMYESMAAMENGIASVKRNAPGAQIEDVSYPVAAAHVARSLARRSG